MKKLSIRLKITLWFSGVLIVLVALTYGAVLSVSDSVMQKSIRDNLIEIVEDNLDEIEYSHASGYDKKDPDGEQYLRLEKGFLKIDDDFLDRGNGISTALYQEEGSLLYGQNPISTETQDLVFTDSQVQKKTVNGTVWYVYERKLTGNGLDGLGLWLRGMASAESEAAQMNTIVHISLILMPVLLLLAVVGGYFIAGKLLKPIQKITKTASQIGQGQDLKKRIGLEDGKDELHQLAKAFDDMFDRLDTSFEAERQFTSDASHELRTPMSVIMAQCEYSLEQDRNQEEYKDALGVIRRQGGKMTRLIEDMLAFTRLERKADSFEMKALDFSQLTVSVCEDMALIPDKNISLSFEIEPGLFVRGNDNLLVRVLTNLITNAYRYGKEDGQILVTLKGVGEQAVLCVIDDGIGISAEERQKIFLRFYQSDSARSMGGTGLGLAIAREIAQLHGGSLMVESVLGQGSTFVFKILKNKEILMFL